MVFGENAIIGSDKIMAKHMVNMAMSINIPRELQLVINKKVAQLFLLRFFHTSRINDYAFIRLIIQDIGINHKSIKHKFSYRYHRCSINRTFYPESEQVCEFLASVPLGITASKRKLLRIFIKMQYISGSAQSYENAN